MFVPHHDISANQLHPKMTSSSAAHQLLSLLLTAACLAVAAASDDAKSIVMVEADPYVPLDTEKHLAALDDSDVWLVEFFSPMCGSCTDFKSTWVEVASALNGQVCIVILEFRGISYLFHSVLACTLQTSSNRVGRSSWASSTSQTIWSTSRR